MRLYCKSEKQCKNENRLSPFEAICFDKEVKYIIVVGSVVFANITST